MQVEWLTPRGWKPVVTAQSLRAQAGLPEWGTPKHGEPGTWESDEDVFYRIR